VVGVRKRLAGNLKRRDQTETLFHEQADEFRNATGVRVVELIATVRQKVSIRAFSRMKRTDDILQVAL
jgi:hypothetical protein